MGIIFTKFLEELPESVVFIDEVGIILEANPATCLTFGYERHELLAKNVSILMPEPHRSHHNSYMQRHRETGLSSIIGVGRKLNALKKDGTIFPIFLSISKHDTQDGLQYVGVIRDLSSFEEKSADLKTLGELIDESISDVFILSDPELKIRYLNRRSGDRLAFSEAEIANMSFSELMHETEKVEFENAILELKNGKRDSAFLHSRLCSKDGKCYPVDMLLQRGIFKNAAIVAITGIERSAEREAQRRLGAVLEGVPGYVLLLNKEFKIEFVNRSDLMPMEEVLGKHVLDFFTPDQAKITDKHLKLCQESQKIQRWEVSYDGPSGILWFSNALNAIEDNGYVLIASDITSLKEAQAQVNISSKLATIGELAAGIGHEINNPLTIVLGNLAAIKKELVSENANCLSVGKRVDTIVMASERIKDIVRGFRTFARFDSELNERVSVHRCIFDTIKMVDGIFSNDQVRIVYEADDVDVLVRGSYGRLQQILMNLFINSRDALQGCVDATITVSARIDSGQVVIDVEDNGPGIAKSIRHRLFYPFFTTKGSGKGTGLGLVISRKLALEMNGSLDVVDSNIQGATFRLLFPILATERRLRKNETDRLLQFEKFEGLRVLLVDDEREIRSTIIETLGEYGVDKITEAQNGAEALELLKRDKFDLVLTDMKMPVMGGLELVKAIKNLSLSPKPQIVVVTGGVAGALEKEVRDDLRQLINGYLLKPFDDKEILQILRKAYSEASVSCGLTSSLDKLNKAGAEHQSEILQAGMLFNKYFTELMMTLDKNHKPGTELICELESAASKLLESAGQIARN